MKKILTFIAISFVISCVCWTKPDDKEMVIINNGSLKFEITAKRLYAASQRVL